jgi:hypothetical protein
MWRSHRENKLVVISYFLFHPSSTICIFSPLSPPFFICPFSKTYLFIASLHIIKSKKIKTNNRTLKKDEGNLLYFWCIWSMEWAWEEQDVVKNESGSWVEAKCAHPTKDLWSAGHLPPLFPYFPSTIFPFISTTTPWGQIRELLATWASCPATYLGWSATPWLPYKRAAKGSLVLHPTSSHA